MADLVHQRCGTGASKRSLSRAHFIKDTSQAEQIGAIINGISIELFGRHIVGRADDGAGRCELRLALCMGKPKIRDFDLTTFAVEKNVGGFDISMHEAFCMGGSQSVGDLFCVLQYPIQIQRAGFQLLLQISTIDILHNQERRTKGGIDVGG